VQTLRALAEASPHICVVQAELVKKRVDDARPANNCDGRDDTVVLGTTHAARQRADAEDLLIDRPIERELAKGERHVYRVGLETGQFVRVLIESQEAVIEGTLTAPDGRLAAACHTELRPESLASLAEVAGEYHIAVTSTSGAGLPGQYRLRITELRPGEPLDVRRALAERAVAEGLNDIGVAHIYLEEFVEAAHHFERAIPIHRDIGVPRI
jgi:hypothetical protein